MSFKDFKIVFNCEYEYPQSVSFDSEPNCARDPFGVYGSSFGQIVYNGVPLESILDQLQLMQLYGVRCYPLDRRIFTKKGFVAPSLSNPGWVELLDNVYKAIEKYEDFWDFKIVVELIGIEKVMSEFISFQITVHPRDYRTPKSPYICEYFPLEARGFGAQ